MANNRITKHDFYQRVTRIISEKGQNGGIAATDLRQALLKTRPKPNQNQIGGYLFSAHTSFEDLDYNPDTKIYRLRNKSIPASKPNLVINGLQLTVNRLEQYIRTHLSQMTVSESAALLSERDHLNKLISDEKGNNN